VQTELPFVIIVRSIQTCYFVGLPPGLVKEESSFFFCNEMFNFCAYVYTNFHEMYSVVLLLSKHSVSQLKEERQVHHYQNWITKVCQFKSHTIYIAKWRILCLVQDF